MSPEAVGTLLASPVLGAAAAKLWQWWTERDKAQRDALAARDAATVARDSAERVDLIAELRASRDASDARAAKAQERSEALVDALHALAAEVAKGNGAVTALSDVVNDHSRREEESLAEIRALLRLSGPPTGEQPRASVVPSLGRAPTPPRGAR